MDALILLAVVLAVVAVLVPLARRRLLRERARAVARERVNAHLVEMRRAFELVAVQIGTALLPAMVGAAEACNRMAAAFASLVPVDSKAKETPK